MLSCIDEFATQQLMQCKCGWLLLTAAAIKTSFFRRNEREGCSKHLSISTQRHVSKTRTVLFAISFAWLATSVAFARQLSQSSFITCVAPFSGDGFACIGVAKLNQQECADFATYNGSEGQSFTGPAVATGATYYFVPYTATCQQSITKLSQEGKGSFSECTTASTSEADYLLRVAISKGLITVPGSGTPSSPSCSTSACLDSVDEVITTEECSTCQTSCAEQAAGNAVNGGTPNMSCKDQCCSLCKTDCG